MSDTRTKVSRVGGFELRVVDDYQFDEVTSSMQKMIRRNKEYEACYFAMLLHKSGYYKYVWRRLSVIASEDVGNANPMTPVVVQALKAGYDQAITAKTRDSGDALLFIFQAIMYLCRSEKTREADNLVCLITERYKRGERLNIPEVALDPHTDAGKQMYGRWKDGSPAEQKARHDRFHEEWGLVIPHEATEDRYLGPLKALGEVNE